METKAGTPKNPRLLEVRQETSKEDADVRGKLSSWGPPRGRGPRASSVLDTTVSVPVEQDLFLWHMQPE